MPNIMINNNCNLKCSYCFAEDCKRDLQQMSFFDFQKAVNFITKTSDRIGIIGGEPTIHPEIKNILRSLIMNNKVQTVTLFTNGTNLEPIIDELCDRKINMLINFNDKDISSEHQLNKIKKNLELMKEYGIDNKISLGVNIYKENQNFDELISLLRQYDRKGLRISVVIPNSEEKKDMPPLEYFKLMKPTLMNLLIEILDLGIAPTVDCNFIPSCVFDEEERQLLQNKINENNINTNLLTTSKCSQVIDILPNLNISRCFGVSQVQIHLSEVNDCFEAMNYFQHNIDSPCMLKPADDSCKTCKDFKFGQCSGGCLAYKMKEEV